MLICGPVSDFTERLTTCHSTATLEATASTISFATKLRVHLSQLSLALKRYSCLLCALHSESVFSV